MNRSRRWNSRWSAVLIGFTILIGVLAVPQAADAHPLGNFTVNRYARIETSAGVIRVTYVLDQAEIPTFQEQRLIDKDRDGFARGRADEINANLRLSIDGQTTALQRKTYLFTQPEGQGGLPVSRLAVIYEAPAPAAGQLYIASFADTNAPDRIGWREIIVKARGNSRVVGSDAPSADLTNELRSYPADLIQAPLDLRKASFNFDPGTTVVAAQTLRAPKKGPTREEDGFTGLVSRVNLGPAALALMFLLALGFGAVHALAPGHGKSVMAAYLVGTRGRPIDAVLLGVLVAVMHTGSVLVVGVVLLKLGANGDLSKIYPILTLLSGLVVLTLGLVLAVTRVRSLRRVRARIDLSEHDHDDHDHAHDHYHDHAHDHDHDHAHDHDGHDDHNDHELVHAQQSHEHAPATTHSHESRHEDIATIGEHSVAEHSVAEHSPAEHSHSHGFGSHSHDLPEGVAPLSRRGLIILGTSGGLLPSPSAVIVLVSAATTDRLALGLSLIAVFSIGLAVTLTAIGLALVHGRRFLSRREGGAATTLVRILPTASAFALIVAGAIVTIQGLRGL